MTPKEISLKDLQTLPGVGVKSSEWLYGIGLRSAVDLRGKSPETLYALLEKKGFPTHNRIMLYVLRAAVYAVSEPNPKKHLLKWYNWKD